MPPPVEIESHDEDPRRQVADLLARVSDDHGSSPARRARLLAALAQALASSARAAGARAVLTGRWLADILIDTAPRLRIRKRETLRLHHPGKTDEEIAESLIGTAAKAAGAVGVAGGALAAAEFAAPPTLLSMPVQIAAETLVIAAIEVKLIAELHEVYGTGPPTSASPMLAYTSAWANRRGIDPLNPGILSGGLGAAAKRQIHRRLLGRAGRSMTTLGPFLAGAVAGSVVNHQGTRRLGAQIREELRASRRAG